MPFGDLLQFLNVNLSTGTLQIRQKQVLKMIYFEKGKIISSSSSDPREYLGHFLVSRGFINEEELRIAMDVQRNSKMLLGKILVLSGKVTEPDMTRMLKLKFEETVYSLFLWDEGEFTFYKDEFTRSLFVRIQIEPQGLIFEGVLRKDEWERIRKIFPHNNVVLDTVAGVAHLEPNEEDKHAGVVFGLVNGKRTIDDIVLEAHSTDYLVCRSLFNLCENGTIRIKAVLNYLPGKVGRGGVHASEQLEEQARDCLQRKRFEEALDLLRQIEPTAASYPEKIVPLIEQVEKETIQHLYAKAVPPEKVLKLLTPLAEIPHAELTPEEGFLLSRIDGTWDVRSILSVTPMKEVDTLRLLRRLVDRGLVGFN
jgi:hypothetical protein